MTGPVEDPELECPDILGQITDAKRRFEVDNVQFVGYLIPHTIAAGERAHLVFFLQNTLDVPVDVTVLVEVPSRVLTAKTHLETLKEVAFRMGPVEVGRLEIPIQSSPETPDMSYDVKVEVRARPLAKGRRVRPKKVDYSRIASAALKSLVGVALGALVGVGFVVVPSNRIKTELKVTKEKRHLPREELRYTYTPLWTENDWRVWKEAKKLLAEKDQQLLALLNSPVALESLRRAIANFFSKCGMDLEDSEVYFVAMATQGLIEMHMKVDKNLQESVFMPILQKLLKEGRPADEANLLSSFSDYVNENAAKLLGYAYALSYIYFIDESLKSEKLKAVVAGVITRLREGKSIDLDLVYFPMIAPAGIAFATKKAGKEELLRHLGNLALLKERRASQLSKSTLKILERVMNLAKKEIAEKNS